MAGARVSCFTFLADNLRTFVEHSQIRVRRLADAHRLVTNHPRWLERVLFAPMHMHFHAAHHLWPSIPYYNLPAADAEMRQSAGAEAVTWRGSYVALPVAVHEGLPIAGLRAADRARCHRA